MKKFTVLFFIIYGLHYCAQAQTHSKNAAGHARSVLAKENYIIADIKKHGAGEHGIFYDTLENGIKPEDPANSAGRQYHDIKVTLGDGDAFTANLESGEDKLTLSLLKTINGRLRQVNAFIDTSIAGAYALSYKAKQGGVYTLRVTCKDKAPKQGEGFSAFYDDDCAYTLYSIIAEPGSGSISGNPSICEKLQFLLRQRLTNYLQITGPIADTVFEDKKLEAINHEALFSFDKNAKATITVYAAPFSVYFDQLMQYKDKDITEKAGQYLIDFFKNCLGSAWTIGKHPTDANWYIFKRLGYKDINVIIHPADRQLEILM